ncbi:MAG: MAPEG family protein [Betaproteobacteria bacterium]|nr:MAPEG family protein [Betaproteobacteria bacterium]
MTFAICCVLIAGLLPYVAVGMAKWDRGYDNRDPRGWEEKLAGRSRRAHSAHLNSFEAFPLFAAGVILAQMAGVQQDIVNVLAGLFVAARVAYLWLYLNDKATARSLVWLAGLAASVALLALAAVKAA